MGPTGGDVDPPLAALAGFTRRHRRRNVTVAVLAVLLGSAILVPVAINRADGAAVLVVVEDSLPAGTPGAAVRRDERRADSLLLVQWERRCDELAVTSVSRDLVLVPHGQTLSILFETDGLGRIVHLVQGAFHVRIAATVTLDVSQVEAMASTVGPVTLDFAAAARDRRTGFVGGPGPVAMDPERLVAYLRARSWEQLTDGQWRQITVSDEERIDRLHVYLRAAIGAVQQAGAMRRLDLVAALARHSTTHLIDPVAAAGFAAGASAVRTTTFATAPVLDERTIDDRRSPFAPADLDAAPRLVLAPDIRPRPAAACAKGPR